MSPSTHESAAVLCSSIEMLQARYGVIVAGRDPVRLREYRTSAAFRQAVHRQSIGVLTFFVRERRGRCTCTSDIARWALSHGALLVKGGKC